MKLTCETNNYGRTFLLVNGLPTFTSWTDVKPQIEVIEGKLFVDGKQAELPKGFKGVGDNRHRNWKRRSY